MRLPPGEYRESMLDAAYKLWAGAQALAKIDPKKEEVAKETNTRR